MQLPRLSPLSRTRVRTPPLQTERTPSPTESKSSLSSAGMSVSGGAATVPPLSAPVFPASPSPVQLSTIHVSAGTALELRPGSGASTVETAVETSLTGTRAKRRLPSSPQSPLEQQPDRKQRVESVPFDSVASSPGKEKLVLRVSEDPWMREFLELRSGDPSVKVEPSAIQDKKHLRLLTPELLNEMRERLAAGKKDAPAGILPCWVGTRFGMIIWNEVSLGKKDRETVDVVLLREELGDPSAFKHGPGVFSSGYDMISSYLVSPLEHSVQLDDSPKAQAWARAIRSHQSEGTNGPGWWARRPELLPPRMKLDKTLRVSDPARIQPRGTLILVNGYPAVSTGELIGRDNRSWVGLHFPVPYPYRTSGGSSPFEMRESSWCEVGKAHCQLPTEEQAKLAKEYSCSTLSVPIRFEGNSPISARVVTTVSKEAGFMRIQWDGKSDTALLRSQQQIEELSDYLAPLLPRYAYSDGVTRYRYIVPLQEVPTHLRIAHDDIDEFTVPAGTWCSPVDGGITLSNGKRRAVPIDVARDCKFSDGKSAFASSIWLSRRLLGVDSRPEKWGITGYSLRAGEIPGQPQIQMAPELCVVAGVTDDLHVLINGGQGSTVSRRDDFPSIPDVTGSPWKRVPLGYLNFHDLESVEPPPLPPLPRRPVPVSDGTRRHPCPGETNIGKVNKDAMAISVLRRGDLVSFGRIADVPVFCTTIHKDAVRCVALKSDLYTRDALMSAEGRRPFPSGVNMFNLGAITIAIFPLSLLVEKGLTSSAKTLTEEAIKKRTPTQEPFYVSVIDEEPAVLCLPHTGNGRNTVSLIVIEPTLYMDRLLKSTGASPPKFIENSDALVYEYVNLAKLSLRFEPDGPALQLPFSSEYLSPQTRDVAMKHFALEVLSVFASDPGKDDKTQSTSLPTLALPNLVVSRSPKPITGPAKSLEIDQTTETFLLATGLATKDESGVTRPSTTLDRFISQDMQAAKQEDGIKERTEVLRHIAPLKPSEAPEALRHYLSSLADRAVAGRESSLVLRDIARKYKLVPIEAELPAGSGQS